MDKPLPTARPVGASDAEEPATLEAAADELNL